MTPWRKSLLCPAYSLFEVKISLGEGPVYWVCMFSPFVGFFQQRKCENKCVFPSCDWLLTCPGFNLPQKDVVVKDDWRFFHESVLLLCTIEEMTCKWHSTPRWSRHSTSIQWEDAARRHQMAGRRLALLLLSAFDRRLVITEQSELRDHLQSCRHNHIYPEIIWDSWSRVVSEGFSANCRLNVCSLATVTCIPRHLNKESICLELKTQKTFFSNFYLESKTPRYASD